MRALSQTGARLAAITILMAVLLGILNAPARINHDNAMYLAMGEGLLRGEVPYVDLIDLNPPLIVYLNTIPAAAARLLGIYPPLTFLVRLSSDRALLGPLANSRRRSALLRAMTAGLLSLGLTSALGLLSSGA